MKTMKQDKSLQKIEQEEKMPVFSEAGSQRQVQQTPSAVTGHLVHVSINIYLHFYPPSY